MLKHGSSTYFKAPFVKHFTLLAAAKPLPSLWILQAPLYRYHLKSLPTPLQNWNRRHTTAKAFLAACAAGKVAASYQPFGILAFRHGSY
jgi:hypothetical protein